MTTQTWTEETVEAGGMSIQLVKGGSGQPLLILHDELGHPGWHRFHQALAQNHTLYIPSHPGFGTSDSLGWIANMRDLACWYLDALEDMGLRQVPVIGFSLGGWLAAEMATMCPQQFRKLVLVDPVGIRPPSGEIFDMFLVVARDYINASFLNAAGVAEFPQFYGSTFTPDQAEAIERAREAASLLAWRPFMHNPSLPHLLRRLKQLPTQIIWGKDDTIVPLSAGEVYQHAIPGSKLVVFEQCGHHPEIEQADEFIRQVKAFLG